MATKLVVLGIPWDVDTEGLREYMAKFGPLDDCVVMKERSSGRSRGFGYVTFSSADDAKNVLECEHVLGSRTLEVKIATPKVNNIHENLPLLCVTKMTLKLIMV
jgi:RNA-binding protein Musashi